MTPRERADEILKPRWGPPRFDADGLAIDIASAISSAVAEAKEKAAKVVEELIDVEDPIEDQQLIRACAAAIREAT